jgi:glycopeptide antibiotics resistance protein
MYTSNVFLALFMNQWLRWNLAQKVIFSVILLLLCIPWLEQLDGKAVFHWTLFDYFAALVLLSTFGFGLEYLVRKTKSKKRKFLIILVVTFLFILLWAELAVGVFDSPIAGD